MFSPDTPVSEFIQLSTHVSPSVIKTTGGDALDYLASGATVDMVICDVMMPGMNGAELHAELARRDPAMAEKIVFMTGGAFTPVTRSFLETVRNPRIDKPIDGAALKALVHNLIR